MNERTITTFINRLPILNHGVCSGVFYDFNDEIVPTVTKNLASIMINYHLTEHPGDKLI